MRSFFGSSIIAIFAVSFAPFGEVDAQGTSTSPSYDQLSPVLLGYQDASADAGTSQQLPNVLGFLSEVKANGYINVAYAYNFNDSERTGTNFIGVETPGRIFDIYHNEFTVHNVSLNLEKPVDNENLIGFQFNPTVGKDSAITQDANIALGGNDIDVQAANIQIYAPDDVAIVGGTTFKVGKFLTTAGAELIDAPYNTMFSRTLLFGLAIPFVHTGILGQKTVLTRDDGTSSLLDVSLGIANGWGNHNVGSTGGGNFPTYLTNATLSPSDNFSTTVNYFVGEVTASGKYRNLIDVVVGIDPDGNEAEGLNLSFNFDWASDAAGNATTGGHGIWWGFAGIARWDFNERWYAALRGEYYDDHDGNTIGIPNLQVFDITWTIGYRPFQSLLLRSELRYDKADQSVFQNANHSHQTTLSFDASFIF